MYEEWLVKHGKVYNALGEKDKRFEIFKDNLKFIDNHNSLNTTYKLGLNRFADLTNEEYRAKFLGTRIDPNRRMKKMNGIGTSRYAPRVGDKLPESVDWRKEGAVVGVKDQGSCGIHFTSALALPLFYLFLIKLKKLILFFFNRKKLNSFLRI